MGTPLDFDRYPHGCEIVIPVVLKIPIYIEPVVIERTAVCYGNSHSEVASLKSQLSEAGPVALAHDAQAVVSPVANADINDLDNVSLQQSLSISLRPVADGWHSFAHAIQDLFESGMSGRSRFLQQ
ncbi:hypothetical protein D0962_12045 [Leptolyngbyaceae cyanobacterium CCMR0082]|uniref:Uncharacterized protein n=2 Tax=Adonisia turfae TaxID=2950184 RepID=A0A6M0S543_9CYAN|nr:hypothetical protein [Adonisia turfae]MDV3351124.1 hypothetical protein [Leptothoe sp. LEGE 181152]NEZ55265.1 hypothetical protein [Adonisia turfae CCMR0081]NEZ63506.1 hypothetical protein [Adonisia turfae CCMR0082]